MKKVIYLMMAFYGFLHRMDKWTTERHAHDLWWGYNLHPRVQKARRGARLLKWRSLALVRFLLHKSILGPNWLDEERDWKPHKPSWLDREVYLAYRRWRYSESRARALEEVRFIDFDWKRAYPF